tara:strand:- start:546 stop:833 length:288 start_codon:yes stop_codon:yes gene_type:complete
MTLKDDRTPAQHKTHTWLVVGTDSFMSGWGGAAGGLSYAAWACRHEDLDRVYNWVDDRDEMKRVRVVSEYERNYRPSGCAHLHIYVVDPGHRALA